MPRSFYWLLLCLTVFPTLAAEPVVFPAHTPGSKGTVVVFSPAGAALDSGRWQRTVLRTLPEYGWNTVSATLPAKAELLPPQLDAQPKPHYWLVSGAQGGEMVLALSEQALPMPEGLVLLGPYHSDMEQNALLATQLAGLGLPVLDLSSPVDHPLAKATIAERAQANRRTGNPHYRSIHWALDWDQSANTLAQQLWGWLKQQRAVAK